MFDYMFESHKNFKMSNVACNVHSQRKEFYNQDIDENKCCYNGRIYYISKPWSHEIYVVSSDFQGKDMKIISRVDSNEFYYIHVNVTGIYLYGSSDERDYLHIRHMGFDGQIMGECEEKFPGCIVGNLCFYDNMLYFSTEIMEYEKAKIKWMDVDNKRVYTVYEKASMIERLFCTGNKLIFYATYKNCQSDYEEHGWMIFELLSGKTECLSNPYCNIENVIDNPEVYDDESPQYNQMCAYDRNITFFDFDRDIFWTERTEKSADLEYVWYWEPRRLWGNRDDIIPDLPIWRAENYFKGPASYMREYFDGTYHYYAPHYTQFKSADVDGNVYDWNDLDNNHGECDKFMVMGKNVFFNAIAWREEEYELSIKKVSPLREAWFNSDLPACVIADYEDKIEKNVVDRRKTDCDLIVEKIIGETDMKYNICTFGAKFHIGFGVQILININGRTYECKTHNSVKGRIDGMKKLYVENGVGLGNRLKASYFGEDKLIILQKL